MNAACIVKAHRAGLGSLLNAVITCMELYNPVAVDWRGTLYSDEDIWPMLFQPTPPLEGPYDIITGYPSQWLTYKAAGYLYQMEDVAWREKCHRLWQRIKPLPRVTAFVNWFVEEHFAKRPVVAVLVRAHPSAGEQLTNRIQTLDEYATAIEAELRGSDRRQVYIASSDEQSLSWFRDRFNVRHHPGTRRAETRDVDRHLAVKQNEIDALNVLQEVLIMARTDVLIHPVSNLATACLYINPSLRSVYLP